MYCPVCGVEHAACGGPTTTQPVDAMLITSRATKEGQAMPGPLKRYEDAQGRVFSLSDADAAKRGGLKLLKKRQQDPVDAAYVAPAVEEKAAAEPDEKAQAPAENKARQPAENKAR